MGRAIDGRSHSLATRAIFPHHIQSIVQIVLPDPWKVRPTGPPVFPRGTKRTAGACPLHTPRREASGAGPPLGVARQPRPRAGSTSRREVPAGYEGRGDPLEHGVPRKRGVGEEDSPHQPEGGRFGRSESPTGPGPEPAIAEAPGQG